MYTYTGPILLAINPFKRLKGYYENEVTQKYIQAEIGEKLPPHAYTIADRAYRMMMTEDGKNQSVLVSGESGAGEWGGGVVGT